MFAHQIQNLYILESYKFTSTFLNFYIKKGAEKILNSLCIRYL
nr:MAG TPA: Tryptophan leader peptide [Caudoviricetes sp.]DAU29669.1 MAG TPA: Tryptophan leader peptide [Herelleviridae sp.]